MKRRDLIRAGLWTAAGASGLVAATSLADRSGLLPPDSAGIFGPGEALTYAAQRLLTKHSMAREFRRDQISKKPVANATDPPGPIYEKLKAGGFADWQLTVDGMVARPISLTIPKLREYPSRSQITHLACEEGWSYIAEWTGVPLSAVLHAAGVLPDAKYVVYHSIAPDWWDSIDLADAYHPQTLLAYGLNGDELPVANGGPLRMRVPRQLGYKSVKYIACLTVTDSLKKFGKGLGSAAPEGGYAWYAGI